MKVSLEVFSKASGNGMTRRFTGLVPLGCLLLTCCMGETVAVARQDVESSARPAAIAAAAPQQIQPPPAAQLAGSTQAPNQVNQDVGDIAQEGRLLLAAKSSKPEAKKSKSAPAAKRLDASKEAEEEEKDEEENEEEDEDAEDSSGKGSGGLGSHTIQTDFDKNVTATLKDVVVRGAVLSATVSLNYEGGKEKKHSESLGTSEDGKYTHLLDYETGTTYPIKKLDGFTHGRLNQGQDEKTLRATFEAPPKNVKTVAITIYGIGTFDDVKLGGGMSGRNPKIKGSKTSGKPSDSTGSESGKEEDEEEDEEEEDEDEKSLAGKGQKASGEKGR